MLQKPDEVQIVIHDQPISGVLQFDAWLRCRMDAATAIFMGRVRDLAPRARVHRKRQTGLGGAPGPLNNRTT